MNEDELKLLDKTISDIELGLRESSEAGMGHDEETELVLKALRFLKACSEQNEATTIQIMCEKFKLYCRPAGFEEIGKCSTDSTK